MHGVIVKESSFTFGDLDSFVHLNNFVKEPLRLYSPATTIYRHAGSKVMVGSVHIPKDASFKIVAAVTSLNPLIWGEDAESLKPDR
ncbi:hypothetical protein G7054_g2355 [Neopestalotiopsis clavispora]|nr:hypothetical protein G7054_g2355 [Neopestalotiopsis clavispora]